MGYPLLCVVWALALTGIVMKQFAFDRMKVLQYAIYPVLGWLIVVAGPVLWNRLSGAEMAFLIAGGLLYTIGFPVLLLEKPDPWPRTFGYHEVWHSMTVLAGACHFATITLLVA